MLLQVFILFSTIVIGLGVASRLHSRNKLLLSLPMGVLAFSWISFVLANLVGFNQNEIIAACLACTAIGATLLHKQKEKFALKEKTGVALLAVSLIAFTLLHGALLHYDPQGGLQGFLTDFNFHASIASTIASGNFPPSYPFYLSGITLSYYYFPHFYAAHYLAAGADLPTAFLLFSTAVAWICLLVYLLAKGLGFSKNASLLSPVVFLSISSLAFLQYFSSSLSQGASLASLLAKPEVSVNLLTYQNGFAFVGVLAQFLLSQASMPVGLALCMMALLIAVENNFSKKTLVQAGALIVLAIPFQAFLAAAFASVIVLQYLLFEKKEKPLRYLQYAPLALSGVLLYFAFFSQKVVAASQKISLTFGWMAQEKSIAGAIIFWLQSFFFLLIPLAFGWKELPKKLRELIWCSMPLFVLVNFVSFTPNPWDSGKMLLPALVLLSLCATHFAFQLFEKNYLHKIIAIAFLLLSCFFTFMVVQTLIQHGNETVFSSQEMAACKQIRQLTGQNSLFIVSNGYTCIPAIAGRRVFIAEPTQLEANALNTSLALQENEAMLQGNCTKTSNWGVTHFYDGGEQPLSQNANYSFFELHGSKVWSDGRRSLYQISC